MKILLKFSLLCKNRVYNLISSTDFSLNTLSCLVFDDVVALT